MPKSVRPISAKLRKREQEPDAALPFARHLNDQVVLLDTGALMLSFRLEGTSFETADPRDLNDLHAKLNNTWRNVADDQLAIWHHVVRRASEDYPNGRFRSRFAAELDHAYRDRLQCERLFINELYLTLVLHAGRALPSRLQALFGRLDRSADQAAESNAIRRIEDAGRNLTQHLGRYGPTPLGLRTRNDLVFSEPMELMRLILTGRSEPVPLVRGHLGASIYSARLIFGREALEIREASRETFAGVLGVKEYPASTRPGLWNDLLAAPFPLVVAQSFSFLSKPAARALLARKQNQMVSARDRAASQVSGLEDALDDLVSNRFVLGDHQASVLVYGAAPGELANRLAKARALMADSGLVVAREDLGLEAAFWAQFPGAFRFRLRPAAITSRNFASFAPLHTHPSGRLEGNHWGPAVALLRSSAASPFHFSFHVGDVGHTFVCGPTGAGKTVVQNFLLAQLEKFGARQVFIDKDRGAEIFVRACGGTYLALRPGEPTGFAPLKALGDTPADRTFLSRLIQQLAAPDGQITPREARAIDAALAALSPLPPRQRSISALRALLGQRDADGIGARLERWRRGNPLGWVFDGEADALDLSNRFLGFDITHILDVPEIRTPVMMYLLHRLQVLVDGQRLVLDIDEFWKALGDEAFQGLAQDGLKTFRKQNAFMVFGTQSPADVLRSPIAHTIVEQCATKIFLPNSSATERDYREGFGLSEREFALVRDEMSPERRHFLVKQGHNSIVVDLDLTGLDDELAVLSGRTQTVELLDRIRGLHGDDPDRWRLPFQNARRNLL